MTEKQRKGLSDETFDAIAAVLIIAVAVTGAVFWLYGMPS